MKKIFISLFTVLLITGCGGGNYKEGVYEATVTDNYGGQSNIASAKVEVGSDGKIKSVYLDGVATTKKELGYDYGMKNVSNNLGVIDGGAEWFEQVEALEKKVVSEQGIDFIKWTDDSKTKTDSVAGCTIDISALYEALSKALEEARK